MVARPRALIWDAGAGNISLPKRFGTGNCNDFRSGFRTVDSTAMSALRALADSLGLSPTTVSRALDGYGDVAQTTRQRVRLAADAAGYWPNAAARRLRRGTPEMVSLVLPTEPGHFNELLYIELLAAM